MGDDSAETHQLKTRLYSGLTTGAKDLTANYEGTTLVSTTSLAASQGGKWDNVDRTNANGRMRMTSPTKGGWVRPLMSTCSSTIKTAYTSLTKSFDGTKH